MPRLTLDDIVISAWNSWESKDREDSEKFLEFSKKLLTNEK